MSAIPDGASLSRNHHSDVQRLSQMYRDAQLSGVMMSMTHMAEMAKRAENQTYAYRERGQFGLRRW